MQKKRGSLGGRKDELLAILKADIVENRKEAGSSASRLRVHAMRLIDRQSYDAVNDDAAEEVQRQPDIEPERLVLERGSEVGIEDEEVDRVARQDRGRVLDPPAGRHSQECHGGILSSSGRPGNSDSDRVATAGSRAKKTCLRKKLFSWPIS